MRSTPLLDSGSPSMIRTRHVSSGRSTASYLLTRMASPCVLLLSRPMPSRRLPAYGSSLAAARQNLARLPEGTMTITFYLRASSVTYFRMSSSDQSGRTSCGARIMRSPTSSAAPGMIGVLMRAGSALACLLLIADAS